ncbi:MAG: hypothetical protein NTU79_01675 [Planctomycetota bacterium]|nr:hypothetical protein [Planctomycetota bacterium]
MNILRIVVAVMFGMFVAGCGKPPMMSVTGSVKLDGKEVPECKVGFFPDAQEFNPDRHGFGSAITDAQGRFEIQHPQGEKGIWAGKYKVTFEAFVTKNGKPLPANSKPSEVEGGVKNLFPDLYREPSLTKEKAVVTSGKNVFDFNIITK